MTGIFARSVGDSTDDLSEPVCENVGMACAIWLVVWLVAGKPNLEWFGSWNDWAVALLGSIVFDVFGGREAARRR